MHEAQLFQQPTAGPQPPPPPPPAETWSTLVAPTTNNPTYSPTHPNIHLVAINPTTPCPFLCGTCQFAGRPVVSAANSRAPATTASNSTTTRQSAACHSNHSGGWCGAGLGCWRGEAGAFRQQQIAAAAAEGKAQVRRVCFAPSVGGGLAGVLELCSC